MARVTGGTFTPVDDPRELRAAFEQLDFSEVETLEIRNRHSGRSAEYVLRGSDGSFSGLVPMHAGQNTLEVVARSTDGLEARRQLTVRFVPGASVKDLTPEQVSQRNRLLTLHLERLRPPEAAARESARRESAPRSDSGRRRAGPDLQVGESRHG